MISAILRYIGAVTAGIVVAGVLAVAVEGASAAAHPLPAGFGGTFEEMCRHVERFPAWLLAAAGLAWGGIALAATWTTRRLGNRWSAAVIGVLLGGAVVLNISMLPYPLWFKGTSLGAIVAGIACGYRLSGRRASSVGSGGGVTAVP